MWCELQVLPVDGGSSLRGAGHASDGIPAGDPARPEIFLVQLTLSRTAATSPP